MSEQESPSDRGGPVFSKPSVDVLRSFFVAALAVSVVFLTVYVGCDYITGVRTTRWRVDFAFEQSVWFVPECTLIYSSLYLMFVASPFVLWTRAAVWDLGRQGVVVTIVAGALFLLFPAELRFPPHDSSELSPFFRIADTVNLTYNLCPSLHVAYAALCAESFRRANRRAWAFHIWALAIAAAAWLTHQHHLIDLFAGYGLGVVATRFGDNKKRRLLT